MGYCVQIVETNLVLKRDKLDKILKIWKDLNKSENNHLKKGGDGRTRFWYSWMSANYDKECGTVGDILDELGFSFYVVYNVGDIQITNFSEKIGQEDLFFSRIAHLIDDGMYVKWLGEDGHQWEWKFHNGTSNILASDDFEEIPVAKSIKEDSVPVYMYVEEVKALKISDISLSSDYGFVFLSFYDYDESIEIDFAWFHRHKPSVGGWYVFDDDYSYFMSDQSFASKFKLKPEKTKPKVGDICSNCNKGSLYIASLCDDFSGILTCDNCNSKVY